MLPPTYYDPAYLNVPVAAAASAGGAPTGPADPHAWKDGSFSFHDVLDTLNPLQHLPLVGTLYRWITGDEPGDVARIAGDSLYGGPVGFMTGLFSVGMKEQTGKDPGETIMAALTGKDDGQVTLGSATPVAAAAAPVSTAAVSAGATPAAPSEATAATPSAAVSATAPATAAAAMPAVPVTAAAQPVTAGPPHAFMSLYRSPAAASAATATAPTSPAEQAFLAQSAAYQRSFYGPRPTTTPRNFTRPIPLQLTGAEPLVPATMQPAGTSAVAPAVAPAARPPAVTPAAAPPAIPAAATAPTAAFALPQYPPVDIPQRMMDALDKYARMKQAQDAQQRGQQVDVAP